MTEVKVRGAWFGKVDLILLRAMDTPKKADEIIAEAVSQGVSEALARTMLERLWSIAAVEHDTRKMSRTWFGDEVLEAAKDARPHRLRHRGEAPRDHRARVGRVHQCQRILRYMRVRLRRPSVRLSGAPPQALLGGYVAHRGGDAAAGMGGEMVARPRVWEHPLMKSEPGYFNCSNCGYHCIRDGHDWCGRRERRMRWNPVYFLCGAYCVCDDIDELLPAPDPGPAPSPFPEIVLPDPGPVRPTAQTSLDQWV